MKVSSGKQNVLKILFDSLGGRYSLQLGIDLSRADSGEIFKWFLASKLFAARISSSIAIKTYCAFEKSDVLTPWQIQTAGWDCLVKILDEGSYVRYDFSTATRLLDITDVLIKEYSGDLNVLHARAEDKQDLERRLKGLGKGIGDVTVNVFLRELRGVWQKADPQFFPLAQNASCCLGLTTKRDDPLKVLKRMWADARVRNAVFPDLEAALVKLGKDFCKKKKCTLCPMHVHCRHPVGNLLSLRNKP